MCCVSKKNWMLCNVVNGSTFLRERERENLQNSMLKCGISILNDRGLEEEHSNILIHGKGNGIDSWSILVDVTMTALFKTHNINE